MSQPVTQVENKHQKALQVAELFGKLLVICDGYSNSVTLEALKALAGTYNQKVVFGTTVQAPQRGARATPKGPGQKGKLKKNSSPEVVKLQSEIQAINKEIAIEAKGTQLPIDHPLLVKRGGLFRALKEAQNQSTGAAIETTAPTSGQNQPEADADHKEDA